MRADWHMILTISWRGAPRCAVTAHCFFDDAEAACLETLAADPDAERAYVLRGTVAPTGMRSWQNLIGWRRPSTEAERKEGSFICVLEEKQLLASQEQSPLPLQ